MNQHGVHPPGESNVTLLVNTNFTLTLAISTDCLEVDIMCFILECLVLTWSLFKDLHNTRTK